MSSTSINHKQNSMCGWLETFSMITFIRFVTKMCCQSENRDTNAIHYVFGIKKMPYWQRRAEMIFHIFELVSKSINWIVEDVSFESYMQLHKYQNGQSLIAVISRSIWRDEIKIIKHWNQGRKRNTETNYRQNEITGGDEGVLDKYAITQRTLCTVASNSKQPHIESKRNKFSQDKVRRA